MQDVVSDRQKTKDLCFLSISVVTYQSDLGVIKECLRMLMLACRNIHAKKKCSIYVVDNSEVEYSSALAQMLSSIFPDVHLISGHGNIGYGRANNLALQISDSEYHLILNPDAFLEPIALKNGIDFLTEHKDTALVTACGFSRTGDFLFLAKREPTFFMLALRGFAPKRIKSLFVNILNTYEMRDVDWDAGPIDIQYSSGSFMLCPTELLRRIGGFNEKYFLYFEDFELCRRLRSFGRLVQLPTVRFVHLGGETSSKGYLHIKYFVSSALRFRLSGLVTR